LKRKTAQPSPVWPADAVERRPLDKLIPYARNARRHTDEQIARIAASMSEWGWTMPALVDESDVLIAGHGRVLAALKLGWGEAPVMIARGWTEEQKRAYRVADNRLSELSQWDNLLLASEFVELRDLRADLLEVTGFTAVELEAMLAPESDPAREWQGMPEFKQGNKTAYKTLAVHLKDEAAVKRFSELVGQPITDKTRFLWYPQAEIERYVDKRYSAE
jgi:ParB-like chromosome segregation protein Spo0J